MHFKLIYQVPPHCIMRMIQSHFRMIEDALFMDGRLLDVNYDRGKRVSINTAVKFLKDKTHFNANGLVHFTIESDVTDFPLMKVKVYSCRVDENYEFNVRFLDECPDRNSKVSLRAITVPGLPCCFTYSCQQRATSTNG